MCHLSRLRLITRKLPLFAEGRSPEAVRRARSARTPIGGGRAEGRSPEAVIRARSASPPRGEERAANLVAKCRA